MATLLSPQLEAEYQTLFDNCTIKPEKYAEVDRSVQLIVAGRKRYEAVSAVTHVPWYFIGVVHNLECQSKFTTHLHNGDPLTARTVQVPAGRPKAGSPPFAWDVSAVDSLQYQKLDKWTNWSIPGILFQLEAYNGFGYRRRGINSPYLWSYSDNYVKGKFAADGLYNPNLVSKQCGAAVLLRRLSEKQIAIVGELDLVSLIKKVGSTVSFLPNKYTPQAEQLQILLNKVGIHLRVDGKAGRNTSDAWFSISGKYLAGDK